MEEVTNSPINPTQTRWFNNKWNILLIILILLIIGGIIGIFSLDSIKKSNASFNAGTTYKGTWKTPGLRSYPAKLTILSRDRKKVKIKLEWYVPPRWLNIVRDATILPDGRRLDWGSKKNPPHFTFQVIDETHLSGKRENGNIISEIIMTKK